MKSKQLNEKQTAVVALEATTETMELTSSELTNVDGGCNKCDRNHDGKVTPVERILCGLRPWPRPWPRPFLIL